MSYSKRNTQPCLTSNPHSTLELSDSPLVLCASKNKTSHVQYGKPCPHCNVDAVIDDNIHVLVRLNESAAPIGNREIELLSNAESLQAQGEGEYVL